MHVYTFGALLLLNLEMNCLDEIWKRLNLPLFALMAKRTYTLLRRVKKVISMFQLASAFGHALFYISFRSNYFLLSAGYKSFDVKIKLNPVSSHPINGNYLKSFAKFFYSFNTVILLSSILTGKATILLISL